ncbi:MAG: MFS transporter [Candidatus Dormibacteraeota bacterium]|nr:MFS transporter [Candidatus Dormibacteraeota bacterium]MBV9526008.1 MFS transporter [Candidatus Dormibacteraeota bacterium]
MSPRARVSVLSARTFRSLHRRNYRLYFIGQVVSLTGTWMQNVAQAWFIVELTHSPLAVGLLAVCQFGPYGLLGLLGGTVADRVNQRRLLICTQTAFLLSAASLATLALTGHATVWEVYLLAAINGFVLVLDTPVRQSFTIQMVGRSELPNAVALNSSIFNASRIIGPAVAGALIAVAGVGLCFLFNAFSFVAVIVALALMRESELFAVGRDDRRANVFRGASEGIRFAWRTPVVRTVLVMMLVISTIGINFNVLLPVLTARTLHSGPQVFGMLSALFGVGALAGALTTAALGRASARALLAGALIFSLSELALAPMRVAWAAALVLVVTGVAFSLYASQSNATLQMSTPDRLRGRVLGIYGYVFFGTAPLGGLLAGWLAQTGGTQLAFLVAGGAGLCAAVYGAAELRDARAPDTALTPGGLHAA